eukprot:45679-Rhodomonas_salina.2
MHLNSRRQYQEHTASTSTTAPARQYQRGYGATGEGVWAYQTEAVHYQQHLDQVPTQDPPGLINCTLKDPARVPGRVQAPPAPHDAAHVEDAPAATDAGTNTQRHRPRDEETRPQT